MLVYRLAKTKYSKDLTGTGASRFGGRWNNKGTPVIYTGASLEIALLELLVHAPPMMIPKLDAVTIKIPDNSIVEITTKQLPINWQEYPAPSILAEIGESWIDSNESLALRVPSAVVSSSHNYILNCSHKDFRKVKITKCEKFRFDPRLKS
jgi:RES domain-containing protein